MKKVFSALLGAISVAALSGCTINITSVPAETPAAPEPTVAPVVPSATGASAETAFLAFVKENAPALYGQSNDRQLVSDGQAVCNYLDDGYTIEDAIQVAGTLNSPQDNITVIYAAITNMCVEYIEELNDFIAG